MFSRYRTLLICVVLVSATLAVYVQVGGHEFINYDDGFYIYGNSFIQKGLTLDSISWAFSFYGEAAQFGVWHPLTSLTHILDIEFFGLNAGLHHLVNMAFHIANTLLVFWVLKRMTGVIWQSAFVAAVFALHPMHVESVAWTAERKDVLSTFFWLLTVISYTRYTQRPVRLRYFLTILMFILALLSKPMVVTLPFVLLLVDYWPLGRLRVERGILRSAGGLIVEKIPFFILSAIACLLSYIAQGYGGAVVTVSDFPLQLRIFNAADACVGYVMKFFHPVNLSIFYPIRFDELTFLRFLVDLGVLAAISLLVFCFWRRRYLTVGWLWFLGMLVPVIGLVQVGMQSMANRYTYIPYIGLTIMFAWGIGDLLGRLRYRKVVLWVFSIILLSFLAVGSWRQVGFWRNGITLFERSINVVPDNWYAHILMARTLRIQKKYDQAIEHYNGVLRIKPSMTNMEYDIGQVLFSQGKLDEAIELFGRIMPEIPVNAKLAENAAAGSDKADKVTMTHIEARVDFGEALEQTGQIEEAIKHYREALRIVPSHARARRRLGVALVISENYDEAILHFTILVRMHEISSEMCTNLGIALSHKNRIDEAVVCFENAIKLEPNNSEARSYLAEMLELQGAD